jgi:anti-sigma factor (TIGR02949 family)
MTRLDDFDSTDCDQIVARLWPHLDGALPESARSRIVEHLRSCTECRSHFDFAQAFLEAVATARPARATPDDKLRARVISALVGEGFTP